METTASGEKVMALPLTVRGKTWLSGQSGTLVHRRSRWFEPQQWQYVDFLFWLTVDRVFHYVDSGIPANYTAWGPGQPQVKYMSDPLR
jgi:hypothetical protein